MAKYYVGTVGPCHVAEMSHKAACANLITGTHQMPRVLYGCTASSMTDWATMVVRRLEHPWIDMPRYGEASLTDEQKAHVFGVESPLCVFKYAKYVSTRDPPAGLMEGLLTPMQSEEWHDVTDERLDASDERVRLVAAIATTPVLLNVLEQIAPQYVNDWKPVEINDPRCYKISDGLSGSMRGREIIRQEVLQRVL